MNTVEKIVLAEIIKSEGSTPRKVGAFLYVDNYENVVGTVGGGKVEFETINDAKKLLNEKKNFEKQYDLSMDGNESIGMVCGGNVTIKFTYIEGSENIKNAIASHTKTKIDSKIYIFGAGHVARALAKVLDFVNYKYVIWDDRKEFACKTFFPNAIDVVCDDYNNIKTKLNIMKDDYVVVMTSGHKGDYDVLKQVLNFNAYYIGSIGSDKKNKVIQDKLIEDGFKSETVKNINAPIGIQIGAETPEEIAISILAEIILYKAKQEERDKYKEGKTLLK